MKKEVKDYSGESKFPMYIGNESIVDFEIDGVKFRCKLGSKIIIWKVGSSKVHLHLDFSEDIFSAVEETFLGDDNDKTKN